MDGQLDQHLRSSKPKAHPPNPRRTWGNLGEIRGGVTCRRTKAAISLKRAKIEEKLLWRAYRKSPMLFRTVPSPTLYGLPFAKIGVHNPTPKLQSLLSQERLKLRTAIWPIHSQRPSKHKPMKNFGEKGAWAYPGTVQIFLSTLYYLRNG